MPRGIPGEKMTKDNTSSGKLVSTIGATEPGVRKGKRSLLACHICCKSSIETTHFSVKVKLSIKVMKLVESGIGEDVTVIGQGSEYNLTFLRGRRHIVK